MTSRHHTTSNQSRNNVMYVNVGVYNVEQCQINVAYFSVDLNNVRQRRNNVAIFNVDFQNIGQRQKNAVNRSHKKNSRQILTNISELQRTII